MSRRPPRPPVWDLHSVRCAPRSRAGLVLLPLPPGLGDENLSTCRMMYAKSPRALPAAPASRRSGENPRSARKRAPSRILSACRSSARPEGRQVEPSRVHSYSWSRSPGRKPVPKGLLTDEDRGTTGSSLPAANPAPSAQCLATMNRSPTCRRSAILRRALRPRSDHAHSVPISRYRALEVKARGLADSRITRRRLVIPSAHRVRQVGAAPRAGAALLDLLHIARALSSPASPISAIAASAPPPPRWPPRSRRGLFWRARFSSPGEHPRGVRRGRGPRQRLPATAPLEPPARSRILRIALRSSKAGRHHLRPFAS